MCVYASVCAQECACACLSVRTISHAVLCTARVISIRRVVGDGGDKVVQRRGARRETEAFVKRKRSGGNVFAYTCAL